MIRLLKRLVVALLVISAVACESRTSATSAAASLPGLTNARGVTPQWSVSAGGGRAVSIADGAVIVQNERMVDRQGVFGVAVYDVASGKELWRREGPRPLRGTPLLLAAGQSLERVDVRSGSVLWRSRELCLQANQDLAYAQVIAASVYAGCQGGDLFRLRLSDGRVLASQDRISVDSYEKLVPLPHGTLWVAGYASIGMYTRSVMLRAQTLEPIKPIETFAPDLLILGVRNDEAIVADVCCRGTPDTNSPGVVSGVSLRTGATRWSAAIHPYHPSLPLSDTEPGAGVFVLAGDKLYVGTRTALFVYRIEDLRTMGSKAPPREVYNDLRDRPEVYDGRYLGISEGKGSAVTRSALFDTIAGRELWSDATRPWSLPPPTLETPAVVEMYSVTSSERRFALLRLSDGRLLRVDAGCYLEAANDRYAATLCGERGRPPELALFDFDAPENVATPPSEHPVAPAIETPKGMLRASDPVLARWSSHEWILIGSTDRTYFFGREPNGIVAVDRKSGAVEWQNTSVCSVARKAEVVIGALYVGCAGKVAVLSQTDGHTIREHSVGMDGIDGIVSAGNRAIVVQGWNGGAALRTDMEILDKTTLNPIGDRQMIDSTFLGVIGDRAYIDDWCCFGRPDQYRPATLYSISLNDGSATKPVDLYPEPDLHPARLQPLGQGEHNYMQGVYFYVVTPNYTYRYDVRNLNAPPNRTASHHALQSGHARA